MTAQFDLASYNKIDLLRFVRFRSMTLYMYVCDVCDLISFSYYDVLKVTTRYIIK